jgi:hypothetical protein
LLARPRQRRGLRHRHEDAKLMQGHSRVLGATASRRLQGF